MVPDVQLTRIPRRNGTLSSTPFLGWKQSRGDSAPPVSARKLAASLWQLTGPDGWQCGLSFDRLAFQFCSSLRIPNSEGATKWDSCDSKARHCAHDFHNNVKPSSAALSKLPELFKSQKHVSELERKMKKMDEERESSMITQHHLMVRSAINNLAKGVGIERRMCRNIDKMNSNLLRDIAEAKLSATKLIRSLQKEKKAREELEGSCYDLAREIEARKAEIWALRDQQERIQLEVEEERKMLQMAGVWREEQAQMKLADANFILEDKYAEVNGLITDLKAFLTSSDSDSNAGLNVSSKAEILRQVFGLVMNQGANKGFKHSIPESDKAFAVTKDSSGVETVSRGDNGEGSVNKMRTMYNAASNRNEATEICSVSLMQPEVKTKGSSIVMEGSSDRSTSRRNPHVIRAMKGHIEWPWRMPAGNLVEAKLERRKMLLRNVLRHKA